MCGKMIRTPIPRSAKKMKRNERGSHTTSDGEIDFLTVVWKVSRSQNGCGEEVRRVASLRRGWLAARSSEDCASSKVIYRESRFGVRASSASWREDDLNMRAS